MIQVKHLSYNFGHNWALKDVSFEVKKGEFLFLTGPSGAGKTTLLRILHASLPVIRGHVQVAGFDLKKLSVRKHYLLRRQVSIVFQDFKILGQKTVWENVALPLQVRGMSNMHIQKRVRAVLRSLHLEGKAGCLGQELSGGEQQRVAVARAIVVNPKVLLADEPTGNLDKELAWQLLEVFNQFHIHGTTIVFATHNEEIIASNPQAKVLKLYQGQIVE
ncbi:cell division ATP-binding protein FtsE [Desulfovulcanus sp.]